MISQNVSFGLTSFACSAADAGAFCACNVKGTNDATFKNIAIIRVVIKFFIGLQHCNNHRDCDVGNPFFDLLLFPLNKGKNQYIASVLRKKNA
jgi:hypothetical protein